MKMRRITFAILFLLLGLTVVSAQVKLSFNPGKGKKYEYQMDMTQAIKQNVMGQEIPMETEMNTKYLMEIKDKTAQETQVQFTYQDITYVMSSPMMKMGYDSKNPMENPSEMDKMMDKIFSNMLDKPFMVVIAPDGSVKSVTGMEAIFESMVKAIAPDGQMAAQMVAPMKQQFSDVAMKNMFEQSLKIYPANAVKVGDSWNSDMVTTMVNMGTAIKTKYTLKEVKKSMATVAVESTVEMNPGEGMEGKLSGTQSGTMIIDTKTGMTVSSDLSQSIKGAIKAQGVDIVMELNTKTKVSTKEIK